MKIIGDTIIDVDIYLEKKENPEEGVPAFIEKKRTRRPGGAANVAHQLKHFCDKIEFYSSLDEQARQVLEMSGLCTAKCTIQKTHITRKYRYYEAFRNINRYDRDAPSDIITKNIEEDDQVVLISDYNKGFLRHPEAREKLTNNIINKAIIDSKPANIMHYVGCYAIKLNEKEAREITNETDLYRILKDLSKISKNVVITRSSKSTLIYSEHTITDIKHHPKQLRNIVGAGDSFLAFLGYYTEKGNSFIEACEKASYAASVYVSQDRDKELFEYKLTKGKYIDPKNLAQRDFNLAFTNGCFDLLHPGHLESIKFAKCQGDKLLVAVNSDQSVTKLKGTGRPIIPLEQRLNMIAALDCVDFVTSFDEETPIELIKACKPDIIVKSFPYKIEDVVGHDLAKVIIAPRSFDISTSDIINKL